MRDEVQFSLTDFMEKYSNEEACERQLYAAKWPNGFVCHKCGATESWTIHANRRLPIYKCSSCHHQTTVTVGTVMEKSKLPLQKWFLAIYMMSNDKRGVSAKQLQRELRVAYQTAWSMSHKIREAMRQSAEAQLGGIVQLDEIYVGGKKKGGKRGRGTQKSKVITAVSLDSDGRPKATRMQVVPNLRRKTIQRFIAQNIRAGSTLRTDSFRVYAQVAEGYTQEKEIGNPDSEHLKWLHVIVSNLKAYIHGTYHGLDTKHLQRYLDDFCYRFENRYGRGKQFFTLLRDCTLTKVVTFGELIG